MKKRYKIINKNRFYSFITSSFIILSLVIFSLLTTNKVHSSIYKIDYKEVKVAEGDTLWTIAMNHLPSNMDIRRMVYEIKEFNDMDSGYIYPGNIIKVPVIK
ncbi:LysM peptidoglycan-binding domain-containing protein [Tissierella pigra]|uniref:LysM peptidoglycan-binding domain-containing protein n=1 Tax=Tissierella pigra TaxID=2607614 RepID=A0A6N7XTZ3_9FIRM|nr:LysM peptidoglycan-binding domain-containing protein [Tissierella pigra]MBU5426605.1 LysM peptidoglycan-binding domain-containing protein [Tissierella pigra]MST99954.1 LysM peptidoglycan-binding domain-containing protein [Tissierella pigra]